MYKNNVLTFSVWIQWNWK